MPKKYGYMTGGKHDASGKTYEAPPSGESVDITTAGAGMGTTSGNPNVSPTTGPGGTGSSGSRPA
jgi:hypothetical protein